MAATMAVTVEATMAAITADTAIMVTVADTTGVIEAAVTMAVTAIVAILPAARTTAIRIPGPGPQAPPAPTTAGQIPRRNRTVVRPAKSVPVALPGAAGRG